SGSEDYSDTVAKGNVMSVTPDVAHAKRGTAFVAMVSKGPPPVTVPDVTGKTASQAQSALETAGLVYASTEDFSETVAVGVVISSSPTRGTSAPKGSTVAAVVSKGPRPFAMPNLVGLGVQAAKARATGLGLVVRNTY